MSRWGRVAPIYQIVFGAAAFAGIGVVLTVWFTTTLFTGTVISRPGAVGIVVFAALWTAGAWRMSRMGVWVSDSGVRVRTFLRTRTVAWPDVARFEIRAATQGQGGRYAADLRAQAVWMVLKDGAAIQTPIGFSLSKASSYLPSKPPTWRNAAMEAALAANENNAVVASEARARGALGELRAALRRNA
jgi:PH (Pleckstrin Homology) domain-containing protein